MERFFGTELDPSRNSANSKSPTRLALLVGNAAYTHRPLKNPIQDAELLASVLRDLGFEPRIVRNATKITLDREIVDFGSRLAAAEPGAVALLLGPRHPVPGQQLSDPGRCADPGIAPPQERRGAAQLSVR
jgi:hypothetical protein